MVWHFHLFENFPQFVVIHTIKGFGAVIQAELDVYLEFSCFFYDPTVVGNLISDSFAFSKSILYIWKFLIHVLLKASLEDFENYFAGIWNECNCAVVWTFFGIILLWFGMKTDFFQSCGHCWVFQTYWYIECSTFTTSSFRIWNSSTGITSPLLALFRCFLRPPWLHTPWCLALVEWSHHRDYLGHKDLFVQFSCVFLPCLLKIFCFC